MFGVVSLGIVLGVDNLIFVDVDIWCLRYMVFIDLNSLIGVCMKCRVVDG